MAYQVPPNGQIPRTIRIPILGTPFYRYGNIATSRDTNIINFYFDKVNKQDKKPEYALKKRPGTKVSPYSLNKAASSDVLRGYYYDIAQNAMYWAVNNAVYSANPDSGTTIRTVTTLATSSGQVGFCSYLKSDNTAYVAISDGTDLWLDNWAAVSCTKVTDPDLPTPHQPFPLYLDGYLFLIKKNTSDVYNSDPDNPFSWTPGNFLTAEMGADYALRLAKAKNYMVVIGQSTMEYYWDAGNASGTPMSRNESPFHSIGYITGFAQAEDKIFFVGQSASQNVGIYMIDGFNVQKISNEIVGRTIQASVATDNIKSSLYLNRDGYIVSIDGHNFYVLVGPLTTWVYDIDEKEWYEWRGPNGNAWNIQAIWPLFDGSVYVALDGESYISMMSQALYNDNDSNFTCVYTTEDVDADTVNNKFCYRLTIISDKQNNTGTSNMSVTWSDDDWASSVSSQNINLFNDIACIRQLGKFRTRSFRFSYTDNYPLRITAFELDILVGNT